MPVVPVIFSLPPSLPLSLYVMSKIYASMLDGQVSAHAEVQGLRASGQAGFRTNHSTYDHIFTLRGIIEEARHRRQRVYCCFADFRKAFDTVPRLVRHLQELGYDSEVIWAIVALYERVAGQVRSGLAPAGPQRSRALLESNKDVPCHQLFLASTSTSSRLSSGHSEVQAALWRRLSSRFSYTQTM